MIMLVSRDVYILHGREKTVLLMKAFSLSFICNRRYVDAIFRDMEMDQGR